MAVERPAPGKQPRVVIADERSETRFWLRRALGDAYQIHELATSADTVAVLDARPPDVLIIGGELRDVGATQILGLARSLEENGRGKVPILVVDDGPRADTDRQAIERLGKDPQTYYVIRRPLPASEVRQLIDSAVYRPMPQPEPTPEVQSAEEAARLRRVLEAARRLGQARDLETATSILERETIEIADADRAQCLFFDAETGVLWIEGKDEELERTAAAGIAGFAARTSTPVSAPRAASDPRYVRAIDDPESQELEEVADGDAGATRVSIVNLTAGGDERLFAQPIAGSDGEVHAVLVAVRDGHRPEFEPHARSALGTLAARCGPILHQLALEISAESILAESREDEDDPLFRPEAMEAYVARSTQGDVVRVSPSWVLWSYWVIVGVVVATLVYVSLGTVKEYSSGPALVRSTGRIDVTAPTAGTLTSIEAEPGQRVEAGAPLAYFYDASEAAELRRVESQWETHLQSYLFDPTDDATRRALADLRTERERARARVEERIVRAPHAGVVSDVRGREGQHFTPGDIVMTIAADDGDLYLIALLPGADRPQLEPGMPLRLELSGYAYAYQEVEVSAVASEVIGPAEARRYLGEEVAELPLPPSVVMVNARLLSPTFDADGTSYRYHDGMHGMAEVEIRSERIITALIPGLRGL